MFNPTVRKYSETHARVGVASRAVVPIAACISDYESEGGVMSRRVLCTCVLSLCCVLSVFRSECPRWGSKPGRRAYRCLHLGLRIRRRSYVSSCFVYVRSVPLLRAIRFRPTVVAGRLSSHGAAVGEFQR